MDSDLEQKVNAETLIIQDCIGLINKVDGIENRASIAGYLAKIYGDAAETANELMDATSDRDEGAP